MHSFRRACTYAGTRARIQAHTQARAHARKHAHKHTHSCTHSAGTQARKALFDELAYKRACVYTRACSPDKFAILNALFKVRACALDKDLELLPGGPDCEVSDKTRVFVH